MSHRKTESTSSSSSSASPESPSMSLPFISTSSFQGPADTKPHQYRFEPSFGWSSSSSVTSEDSLSVSPIAFDYMPDHATSPSPSDTSYQPFEISMNNTLSAFPDSSHIVFSGPSSPTISSSSMYKNYTNHGHIGGFSQFALSSGSHDVADQFSMFDGMSTSLDSTPIMGVNWESGSSAGSKVANGGYKIPTATEFVRIYCTFLCYIFR